MGSRAERFARAAQLTAPKVASQTLGRRLRGYWINNESYFYCAESEHRSAGVSRGWPCIYETQSGSTRRAVSIEAATDALKAAGLSVEPAALERAQFEMPSPNVLGVSVGGRNALLDLTEMRVTVSRESISAAALYSPDGTRACVVRGPNLAVVDLASGRERLLTEDGEPGNCYGQPSETGLSAVTYRKRPYPVGLWSPDSQWLVTHQIDERTVPELSLVESVPAAGERPLLHSYKYAIPGDPLPVATYVAIHCDSGRILRFTDCPALVPAFSPFFARAVWFVSPERICLLRFDRYAMRAELIQLDLACGTSRIVLVEQVADGYVDMHPIITVTPNVRVLGQSGEVVWFSERDGWGHLHLHDAASGQLKNRITTGEWLVRDIVAVDERHRRVFFLAGGLEPGVDPARRSLCSVGLDGRDFEVLIKHEGDIFIARTEPAGLESRSPFRPTYRSAGFSPDFLFAVARFTHLEKGTDHRVIKIGMPGGVSLAGAAPASTPAPQVREFTVLAADGKTELYGAMFLPSDFDESEKYPLVDFIYPGPQVMHKPQSYRSIESTHGLALAELGFAVIMIDTRGIPGRSRALHQAGYGNLMEPQLADHAAAIAQLLGRYAFIDPARVGILGESAGGAAAALALCRYPNVFRVGVAVCGNHDPSYYASFWSDKYLGPGSRDAWASQSSLSHVSTLTGKLLLVVGDMDENVHPSHTLRLANELMRANKDFELLVIPGGGHDILATCGYALRRIWDYLRLHLRGESAVGFDLQFEPDEIEQCRQDFWRELRE
jgi:dipeptidyl-peptidase-4